MKSHLEILEECAKRRLRLSEQVLRLSIAGTEKAIRESAKKEMLQLILFDIGEIKAGRLK